MGSGWHQDGLTPWSEVGAAVLCKCGWRWGWEGLTGEHQVVRRNTHTVEVGGFSLGLTHGRIEAVGVGRADAVIAVAEVVAVTAERCG